MSALADTAQSPVVVLSLALLNVLQTVLLAEIASRSRQRRAEDSRRTRRPAGNGRRPAATRRPPLRD